MSKTIKEDILNAVTDLVTNLLYYDRKEDEDLPVGMIEAAIETGEITKQDIIDCFKTNLENKLKE